MSKVEDILEIQMLTQRYADAVMRHNADDWGATWASNGEWDVGREKPLKGREEIVETWSAIMKGYPFVVFLVQPGIVEVNGDEATCRSYVEEIIEPEGGDPFCVYGCYNDELVREDGEWKFLRRNYSRLYTGPVQLPGEKFDYGG